MKRTVAVVAAALFLAGCSAGNGAQQISTAPLDPRITAAQAEFAANKMLVEAEDTLFETGERPDGRTIISDELVTVYVVGKDISPGMWQVHWTYGFKSYLCHWRIDNTTTEYDGAQLVELKAGQEFESSDCGMWREVTV